ncbi:hypothetical protein [Dactylosporangium sp. NPDC049140]|uniref:hypothetical protein n=1 Tax=Dactylosporangium sp. NPDC049140 TaxID=3155647 RepID=UPI0033DFEA2D
MHVGDVVQWFIDGRPTSWKVVGLAEERGVGSGGAYVTAEGLAAVLGRPIQVRQLRIATDRHDEQTRTRVVTRCTQALDGAGVSVATAASVSRSDAVSAGHLGPVLLILLGVAVPLGVIGLASMEVAVKVTAGRWDRAVPATVMTTPRAAVAAQYRRERSRVVSPGRDPPQALAGLATT